MAAIDDLISQVEDKALRKRLREEADRLTKEKKFGLVFEEHLPELTPIYDAPIKRGSEVARRDQSLTETWRVLSVVKGQALCHSPATGDQKQIPVNELVVVRRFGEPIYPALTPLDAVQNGPADAPWHTLIEADNYHALQLLTYLYAGQVDCIYIDPPYNTGARDWKYNNDYVDGNDRWRHSKWLAMMQRRLILAKKLLNPETGVLVVTIDEHEVQHLGMLLESTFADAYRQMITIVITSAGVAKQGLARVEEHAFFVYLGKAQASLTDDDFLTDKNSHVKKSPWNSLLRRGTNALPIDRPGLVYPIHLNPNTHEIIGVGEALAKKVERGELNRNELNQWNPKRDKNVAWPIRSNGALGTWQVNPESLMRLKEKGFVKLGRFDEQRISWAVNYLKRGAINEIKDGKLIINGYEWDGGSAILEYVDESTVSRRAKTVWYRTSHDAGTHGSKLLRTILGNRSFDFPKSLYAVRDTLATIILENKKALVVDFFAGSGTTLHAINLLNIADNGQRCCILVTNNEVSEEDTKELEKQGLNIGVPKWEQHGICRIVTWPRSKFTILGRRDDGTELIGEYSIGQTTTKEKARTFRQLGFIDPAALATAARKKEIVSLIDAIPMSHIKTDTAFFVSEDERHTAAILFDDTQADAFLEALEEMDHLTHFYIVTGSAKLFGALKKKIETLLGPIEVQEEEKRPMRHGFPANLAYFKLDFLEKDEVALGRQFRQILPLLWLRAGAVGPRPELPNDNSLPTMLLPAQNRFAVLLNETRFADFRDAVAQRPDLSHIFLVTDSADTFRDMAAQLEVPNIIQLYRDYLENFTINQEANRF